MSDDLLVSFLGYPVFHYGERELGRQVDALAPGGDEGRDKLR